MWLPSTGGSSWISVFHPGTLSPVITTSRTPSASSSKHVVSGRMLISSPTHSARAVWTASKCRKAGLASKEQRPEAFQRRTIHHGNSRRTSKEGIEPAPGRQNPLLGGVPCVVVYAGRGGLVLMSGSDCQLSQPCSPSLPVSLGVTDFLWSWTNTCCNSQSCAQLT